MPYINPQNLIDRFGEPELVQLTNPDEPGAVTINTAVLDTAIADATAEIDGYLTRYLPLDPVPANLERICCDIARYYLYDDLATTQIKEQYKKHVDYLTRVSEGKISIAPDSTGSVDAPASDVVSFVSSASVFSRDAY